MLDSLGLASEAVVKRKTTDMLLPPRNYTGLKVII